MHEFNETFRFWAVIVSTAIVKVALSDHMSWRAALITFSVAIFSGVFMTDPTMHYFRLDPEYRDFVLIGVSLTGEQFMRHMITLSSSSKIVPNIVRNLLGVSKDDK